MELTKDERARVLGLTWTPNGDYLSFTIEPAEIIFTRRGLLSRLAGIYDPLGLCAPVTTPGKIRMKELVIRGMNWDEPVDETTGPMVEIME